MKTTSGIYRIKNLETGEIYIGKAVNLNKRKWNHIGALRRGNHSSRKLQKDFDKYGKDSFEFETLIEIKDPTQLRYYEWYLWDRLEPEYNIYPVKLGHDVTVNDEVENYLEKEIKKSAPELAQEILDRSR